MGSLKHECNTLALRITRFPLASMTGLFCCLEIAGVCNLDVQPNGYQVFPLASFLLLTHFAAQKLVYIIGSNCDLVKTTYLIFVLINLSDLMIKRNERCCELGRKMDKIGWFEFDLAQLFHAITDNRVWGIAL